MLEVTELLYEGKTTHTYINIDNIAYISDGRESGTCSIFMLGLARSGLWMISVLGTVKEIRNKLGDF